MTLKEHINMTLEEQQRKEKERKDLDARLSPFKTWDIVADVKWELIWVFKNVAYHWWNPDVDYLWNFIFAEFKRAISKQWWTDWRVINAPCGDDDTYIDRRESDLTENYGLATPEQIALFKTLMAKEENSKLRDKERRRLRMKKKRKTRKW